MNKMNNFTNALQLEKEKYTHSVAFQALADHLTTTFSVSSLVELLALPALQYDYQTRSTLLLNAFEDGEIHDVLISEFCRCIIADPLNCNVAEAADKLEGILKNRSGMLTNAQLFELAHAFENLFAAGFEQLTHNIATIYRAICLPDAKFHPYSYDNCRLTMALLAYRCKEYSYPDIIHEIRWFYKDAKAAGTTGIKGMAHYYIGLCERHAPTPPKKSAFEHMQIAHACHFPLAQAYLEHPNREKTIERSKDSFPMQQFKEFVRRYHPDCPHTKIE